MVLIRDIPKALTLIVNQGPNRIHFRPLLHIERKGAFGLFFNLGNEVCQFSQISLISGLLDPCVDVCG